MHDDLLDKDTTLDLAARISTAPAKPRGARISLDPRVWLGALALRGSVVAENKTPEAEQTPKDRKSYIPRDLALSYLQARQEERTATGVRFADRLDGSTRRSLLLSHYQPFTRDAAGDAGVVEVGNLLAATGRLRRTRGVDAWFWGHEHRLFAYGARSGIRYATCMGHGAVLAELGADVAGPGEAEFRQTFRDHDGDVWRKPGFTVVDLDGAAATVRYVDMDGML
jgi:hypothetical protein